MDSIECAKVRIKAIIAGSEVPEDPHHAENTLDWLLRLAPKTDFSRNPASSMSMRGEARAKRRNGPSPKGMLLDIVNGDAVL